MFPRDSMSKGYQQSVANPFPTTNKGGSMSVDQKTVRHIARLARIAVRDDELEALSRELNGILDWVEQLGEVDVSGVEPMTSAVAMSMKMRDDTAVVQNLQDAVIRNAPGAEDGFFVVPKVVE